MQVTVVRPSDLGPAEADTWAKFQQNSSVTASAFFSLTFARAVGRARPAGRVAVIEQNGQISAFLPFETSITRMGMPIGYPMNNLHGFVSSGAPLDARRIIRQAALRGWRFISAPADQQALAPHQYLDAAAPVPVINLGAGQELQLNRRRKSRRALEQQYGDISFQWHSLDREHLRRLLEWKAAKYAGTRKLLSSDPTALRIIEELAWAPDDDCRGVVSVLSAGDRAVAVHLGLLASWGLSGWFTSYDPGLSRFAPGTMLWHPLAAAAAQRGVARIDLGHGQENYKFALSNDSYPAAGGAVWASRAEAAARRLYRRLRRRPSSDRGIQDGQS